MSRGTIPNGPCELCVHGAKETIPQDWGPYPPVYVDSVPNGQPGTHPNESGYRWQLLCMVHASERRRINTSRVQPILWCESEGVFRIDMDRAGGDCLCECRRKYYDHPHSKDYPFLNVLCDGSLVKL